MSDTRTNPAEPPVNDGGGGTAPEPDPETTEEQRAAETPVNQGGG
jgi:hypothetical protein